MKRIAFCVLALTLVFVLSGCKPSAQTPAEEPAVLRYDGIYCYIRDFDDDGLINNYALRFYEDGTVIHTSVEQKEKYGTYFPSTDWFNKEDEYYADLLGSYEVADGAITLITYDRQGSVAYQGTVQSDKLVLDSHSNINGYEVNGSKYVFYSFDELSN